MDDEGKSSFHELAKEFSLHYIHKSGMMETTTNSIGKIQGPQPQRSKDKHKFYKENTRPLTTTM